MDDAYGGFRLDRLEVLNWGTFDRHIWIMEPRGMASLLTGANGSGKSTLVDALLTLIVPTRDRHYNRASGERRRERDERSYIKGAYSRRLNEDTGNYEALYLRTGNDARSVLLAVFYNAATKATITIAQFLYIEGDTLQKLFTVAEHPLSITEHFMEGRSPKDIAAQLRKNGAETWLNESGKYAARVMRIFNLRSEQAFELFNKVVSLKEIERLDRFIRDHMLDDTDSLQLVEDLKSDYRDSTLAYNAVVDAEHQLEALRPITELADKRADYLERIKAAQRAAELTPVYFALRKIELLNEAIQAEQSVLEQCQTRVESVNDQLESIQNKRIALEVAYQNNSTGQEIERIKRELDTIRIEGERRGTNARRYDQAVQKLRQITTIDWKPYQDESGFTTNRQQADRILRDYPARRQKIITERDALKATETSLKAEIPSIEREIHALEQRKSRIPENKLNIRELVVEGLGIPEDELPFVGELIRVREEEQNWEPAIQRLLGGFGLKMLVPEALYGQVSRFVNSHNLRGRLDYERIRPTPPKRLYPPQESNAVFHKLEVKHDTPFRDWLNAELVAHQHYICCSDLAEFQREEYALTIEGQMRRGTHHIKDDSATLHDPRNFVLGWDNRIKVEALRKRLAELNTQSAENRRAIEVQDAQQRRLEDVRDQVNKLMALEDFRSIDYHALEVEYLALEARLQKLTESSDSLREIQAQLEQVKQEQSATALEQRTLQDEISQRRTDIKRYTAELERNEKLVIDLPPDLDQYQTNIEEELQEIVGKTGKLPLEEVERVNTVISQRFNKRAQVLGGAQYLGQVEEQMVSLMQQFLHKFPIVSEQVSARLEAADGFRQLRTQIEHDDLPRSRERFKNKIESGLTAHMATFQGTLNNRLTAIRKSIEHLNSALREIPYTDATYIELRSRNTKNTEVRQFRDILRNVQGDAANVDLEATFLRIQKLIEMFEQDERWTKLVTDVRFWLDFDAVERYRENNEEKETHNDSSGKSGGEKAKLAYTILASAVAYQYGLDQPETRNRTLRLVVVDEAFSKSDDRNADFAMQLFQRLGLQLLVVTPMDKLNVVVGYIGVIHFVANNQQNNKSQVRNLTIEQYESERTQLISTGVNGHDFSG